MSTRLKLALALALGALTLLPAAGAQAATVTPAALTLSTSFQVPSAPQTVTYSVVDADSNLARHPKIGIRSGDAFHLNFFSATNNCDSLPAAGSGQCAVSVTFTPQAAGFTTHSTLVFNPPDANATSIPFATASLTGVAAPAPAAGVTGKKCHKKGKKASAAKKCKKRKG
jgi:hypothetical protein